MRGCPPTHEQVWNAINQLILEALPKTDERLLRMTGPCATSARAPGLEIRCTIQIHEAIPDPEQCLLEQGFICAARHARRMLSRLYQGKHALPRCYDRRLACMTGLAVLML